MLNLTPWLSEEASRETRRLRHAAPVPLEGSTQTPRHIRWRIASVAWLIVTFLIGGWRLEYLESLARGSRAAAAMTGQRYDYIEPAMAWNWIVGGTVILYGFSLIIELIEKIEIVESRNLDRDSRRPRDATP